VSRLAHLTESIRRCASLPFNVLSVKERGTDNETDDGR
jgi:hypothetical protein